MLESRIQEQLCINIIKIRIHYRRKGSKPKKMMLGGKGFKIGNINTELFLNEIFIAFMIIIIKIISTYHQLLMDDHFGRLSVM